LAAAISRASDQGVHTSVHSETITDPALGGVVTGEHPELGLVVLVKTGEGTVLLKDGERRRS
jgi:hypothetical protein